MSDYLETIASYLPALLRQQLADRPAPLNAPRLETFPAAFLFGDITGFTPLTVRLAEKGEEGVEELSRLLNGYFDRLITLLIRHGGDIIKIAGDGVLVVWPARNEPLGVTVLRVAQCAQSIQAELHNYQTFEGARLALRIGLGAGSLTLAQLGGIFGRWEALATGTPITQSSSAESRCQPGQVIIAPEAWALAQDALQIELVEKEGKQALRLLEVRQPPEPVATSLMPIAPAAEYAARSYIPGAILQRLAAGQTAFLSELRRLTIIFVNLPGFERLDHLEAAQTLIQTLQRALYHYEGSVNQLIMDDKGTTLVAALGLPPFAHEDDPARGLLAALEMAAGLRLLQQRYAIGVTSGHVYCGERGNNYRREYALLGDAVNTAARLMQAVLKSGKSDIYCDAASWQAARGRLDFEALDPVLVKGKTAPVPIYRPLREKLTAVHAEDELVGRETEKDFIGDALQALLRGELQGPLMIEGEAGMGKSRLVEEVKRQAQATGLAFFNGAGDANERTSAYHAWRSIVRQYFGLLPAESLEEQRAKVEAALPRDWRAYAPLLDSILPLNFRETGVTSALRPQSRLDKTHDLINELFRSLCTRAPTVLVLEDAQWFDTASWNFVTVVSRFGRTTPLLIILTTRPLPEPYPPEYVHLLEAPGCRPLRLGPLDRVETAALIAQRLKISRVGPTLREFVQQRAEGNPFFVEEILLALRQAGALLETPDGCELKPGLAQESITLPNTVQGLIANRIDRLKPSEQMTIKVASVLGRVFDAGMLRAVYPMSEGRGEIDHNLKALQERDFISSAGAGSYVFKHALTREAIYNQMLFAQRRKLHRAVAEWVEMTNADDLEPHYALLAHHWRRALGDVQEDAALLVKALDYLEKAGDQANARFAYAETVEFFSRALDLVSRLSADLARLAPRLRQMRWLTILGIAQYNLGHISEARQALEQTLELGDSAMPVTKTGLYLALAREMLIQAWHRLRPGFLIPYRSGEREQLTSILAEAQAWLYAAYYFNNQFLEVVLTTLRSVNAAENLHRPPAIAQTSTYAALYIFAGIFGRNFIERIYGRLIEKAAVTTFEPLVQGSFATILSTRFIGLGEWKKAQEYCDNALAMLEQYHPTAYRDRGNLLTQLCFVHYYQGRYHDHLDGAEIVGQFGRLSNNLELQAWHVTGWAMDHSLLGNFKALHDDLARLERFLPDIPGSGLTQLFLPTYRGRLAIACQDWELAEACADQLNQMLADSPFDFYSGLDGRIICAEVPLARWQRADSTTGSQQIQRWKTAAQHACRNLWHFARLYPIGKPAAGLYQGYYDWLAGQPARARQRWQASLEAARQLSMPHYAALAHWALARLPGPEQAAHLQAARELLEGCGALAYFNYLQDTV